MTGYQAVIGPDTAFTPDFKPVQFQEFTDGTKLSSSASPAAASPGPSPRTSRST